MRFIQYNKIRREIVNFLNISECYGFKDNDELGKYLIEDSDWHVVGNIAMTHFSNLGDTLFFRWSLVDQYLQCHAYAFPYVKKNNRGYEAQKFGRVFQIDENLTVNEVGID